MLDFLAVSETYYFSSVIRSKCSPCLELTFLLRFYSFFKAEIKFHLYEILPRECVLSSNKRSITGSLFYLTFNVCVWEVREGGRCAHAHSPPGSSLHRIFHFPWKFSRQEYCSGLLFPSPGDIPKPGIKTLSPASPALAGGFFTTSATWEALNVHSN